MKRPIPLVLGVAAVAALLATPAAAQTRSLAQSTLLNFSTGFDGSVNSVAPGGCGIEVDATLSDNGGFSRVVVDQFFDSNELDLSGSTTLSFDITLVSGSANSVEVFLQTSDNFDFQGGSSIALVPDAAVRADFTLTGVPNLDNVRGVGFQVFGDPGQQDAVLRIEPVVGASAGIACTLFDDAATLAQTQLAGLGTEVGSNINVQIAGTGVQVTGAPMDEDGFSRLSVSQELPNLDFAQFGVGFAALNVTKLAGGSTGARLSLQNGAGFTFVSGDSVDLTTGEAVTVCLDLALLADPDDIVGVFVEFFGPDADTTPVELLIEPVSCAVDDAPPNPCEGLANVQTLDQSVLLNPQLRVGTGSAAPSGAGVLFTGSTADGDGFSEVAIDYVLTGADRDLSDNGGVVLTVTDVSGTLDSARLVVFDNSFVFNAGPTIDLIPGLPTEICFDLSLLPGFVIDDSNEIEVQAFAADGVQSVELRIEPAGSGPGQTSPIVDLVAPFGVIDVNDHDAFVAVFDSGCQVTQATLTQAQLLNSVIAFPDSERGVLTNVAADQDGVLLDITTAGAMFPGDSAFQVDFTGLDLSAFDLVALNFEVVSGEYFNAKAFIQTDTGTLDMGEPVLNFAESEVIDFSGDTRVPIDLTSVPDTDDVVAIGSQFFGPDGNLGVATQIRVTPADPPQCNDADLALPFSELDAFDRAIGFDLFGVGL